MAARIASGRSLYPRLVNREFKSEPLPFSPEALAVARQGMDLVVNGAGTAVRSRLPLDGLTMAGNTGTAQVRGLRTGNGTRGPWKFRDPGLFVRFAPSFTPRPPTALVPHHGLGCLC